MNTHTGDAIKVADKVYARDLYGDPYSFVLALKHVCVAPIAVVTHRFP